MNPLARSSRRRYYADRYDPVDLTRREFSDALSRILAPGIVDWRDLGDSLSLGVDVREDGAHVYVEADLPGFRKEDVEISLDHGVLNIVAEKHEQPEEKGRSRTAGGNYLLRERHYERMQRSLPLPANVDEQNVEATLRDGCLCITLNKVAGSPSRKIRVR